MLGMVMLIEIPVIVRIRATHATTLMSFSPIIISLFRVNECIVVSVNLLPTPAKLG